MTPGNGAVRKAHILLVDSDHSLRKTVSPLLRAADYEVSHAEGCVDALLQLHANAPDIIVSDLDLPDDAGLAFVSILRRHCPETPVIALSGAEREASGVPANALYVKGSYHPQEFLKTVAALLHSGPNGTAEVHVQDLQVQEPPQEEAA